MRISDWSSDVCSSDLQNIVALHGDDAFAERNLRLLNGRLVERWHFPMVSDGPRNALYEQALRAAIDTDSVVLDIGAGSGLLSMMAARAGARHVIASESNPAMAELPREIIADNRSEEQTAELQSLMSTSYAVLCWQTKKTTRS